MGIHRQFICQSCGYEAIVSGGDGVGWACRTTTLSCQDCRELFDVVTSEQPWDESVGLSDKELVCPRCRSAESNRRHCVERWTAPGPCPKCGQVMDEGDVVECWD
jgi:hypothetical protein